MASTLVVMAPTLVTMCFCFCLSCFFTRAPCGSLCQSLFLYPCRLCLFRLFHLFHLSLSLTAGVLRYQRLDTHSNTPKPRLSNLSGSTRVLDLLGLQEWKLQLKKLLYELGRSERGQIRHSSL